MSIWLSETAGIDTNNAYGNNVTDVDNHCSNTRDAMKMPWLCMLCDVRVCIVLTVMIAVAFTAIIIAILILMH